MLEKVAREIARADEQNGAPPYEYVIAMGKHAKAHLFDQARAAIEAMRDPDENMSKAGRPVDRMALRSVDSIYQAMIDAALNDQS